MKKPRSELTKLEWELMDQLWLLEQTTAPELQKQMEKSHGWAYSTVKTMLDRLVAIGYVKTRRVGNVYEYSPKSKRPTVVGKLLDDFCERLFGGAVTPFIQTLIERSDLTDSEIKQLKDMLDEHRQSRKKSERRTG